MNQPTYPRPPITEAVVGIDFVGTIDESLLRGAKAKLSREYSNQVDEISFTVDLEIGAGQNTPKTSLVQQKGFRLRSADASQILLLRPASFTVSQLAPYPGWDVFFGRFKRDWKRWKTVAGFREIKRIGLRYINRIDIPAREPVVHQENFLRVYPEVPEQFGPLLAYTVLTKSLVQDLRSTLTVTTGVVPAPILNHMSILFDIDIGCENEPPKKDSDIFDYLQNARRKKNEYFEASITDDARKLFQS